MHPLRIGCVKYLNARPLIHGWRGVEFDHPSDLCKRLANGELDVALVSSFEFLRNPIYRIVDGVSISSDGPVYSVVVAHRGALSEIEEIELDPASQTAVNLLRCLLRERHLNPRLVEGSTGILPMGQAGVSPAVAQPAFDARLLIGDHAIQFRQNHPHEFHFWDLSDEWKKLVGLPFTYALWLIRPEVADAKAIADRLRTLRHENLANLEDVIAGEKEFDPEFCRRYYCDYLQFNFGEAERNGLQTFASLCAKHGFVAKDKLRFNFV